MATVIGLVAAALIVWWVYLAMEWYGRRIDRQMAAGVAEVKVRWSRTPGGSAHSTGRGNPAGATPGGKARDGFASSLACPAGTDVGVPLTLDAPRVCRAQAPVDGGDVPAVLPSTGPTPAGAAATPPAPALAGPPPWLRLAATRRQVCG